MLAFFLPHSPIESQEASYVDIAKCCNRQVPQVGKQIYSITFEHRGTIWVATVSEYLTGYRTVKGKNKDIPVRWQIEDHALVLAIFPGVPFCVMTYSSGRSHFGHIFYATPRGVELFSV